MMYEAEMLARNVLFGYTDSIEEIGGDHLLYERDATDSLLSMKAIVAEA